MESTDSEAMLENGHMDINEKTQKELDDEIKRKKEKQVRAPKRNILNI